MPCHAMLPNRPAGHARELEPEPDELFWTSVTLATLGKLSLSGRPWTSRVKVMHKPLVSCRVGLIDDGTVFIFIQEDI